jgi:hypothetical protein
MIGTVLSPPGKGQKVRLIKRSYSGKVRLSNSAGQPPTVEARISTLIGSKQMPTDARPQDDRKQTEIPLNVRKVFGLFPLVLLALPATALELTGRVSCTGVDANAEQVRRGMAWVFERYAPKGSPLYGLQAEASAIESARRPSSQ